MGVTKAESMENLLVGHLVVRMAERSVVQKEQQLAGSKVASMVDCWDV